MFETILKQVLGDKAGPLLNSIETELKHLAADFVSKNLAKEVSHGLLKSMDTLIAATVKVADASAAHHVAEAQLTEIVRKLDELSATIAGYLSLQIEVELEKKIHGDHSPEADNARHLRQPGIDAVRQKTVDLFAVIAGQPVKK